MYVYTEQFAADFVSRYDDVVDSDASVFDRSQSYVADRTQTVDSRFRILTAATKRNGSKKEQEYRGSRGFDNGIHFRKLYFNIAYNGTG